jgi:hypothetical protein
MPKLTQSEFQQVSRMLGITLMGVNAGIQDIPTANNFDLAADAQPALVTVTNGGIPAYLSTYLDPKIIEVLVAPMRAAEIVGVERKIGDWVTETAQFPVVESTGEVSSYGDFSNSGVADANVNFENRQSYHYQVVTQWGERELEKMGLAKIDWANRKNLASVLTLNLYQNKTYFFGVSGLMNYGLLNDPALPAPITPNTKVAGGTSWNGADALEILNDIIKIFRDVQGRLKGNVDRDSAMTLAMSPAAEGNLAKTSNFNVNVSDLIRKNFPNLTVKTAPQYSTASGELVQLIVDEIDGQRTAEVAFTEKLRAHPIFVDLSSFRQKKSQGTWGCNIYRPAAISQMLGV